MKKRDELTFRKGDGIVIAAVILAALALWTDRDDNK